MDSMIKTVMKRLLLLCGCSMAVTILLVREFSHGLLSPRGYAIALPALGAAVFIGAVLIVKRSAKEFAVLPGPPGTSIDAVTRKRLLWRLRMAKTRIAIMGIALVLGLTQIRDFPVLALLVGLALNLLITAQSVQTVIRLKKILN